MTEYEGRAPVIEYVAPTTAVTVRVPIPNAMSLRDIAKFFFCFGQAKYTVTVLSFCRLVPCCWDRRKLKSVRPFYHLILTIDPNATSLYSTSYGRAVHAPLQATARQLIDLCTAGRFEREDCVRKVCASHPHQQRHKQEALISCSRVSQSAQKNVVHRDEQGPCCANPSLCGIAVTVSIAAWSCTVEISIRVVIAVVTVWVLREAIIMIWA